MTSTRDDDAPEPTRDPLTSRFGLDPSASRLSERQSWPILLFLALSWVSTTFGLTQLISAERGDPSAVEFVVVGAFVFAATASMKIMLDLTLITRALWKRLMAFFGYLLLMGFSIFFGFAFYWELLEARAQTFDGARATLSEANRSLAQGRATLQTVATDVANLRQISAEAAERERFQGFTCEADVGPGDGPRRAFRDGEAARFAADARLLNERIGQIDARIDGIRARTASLNALADQAGGPDEAALVAEFDAINAALIDFETSYNALLAGGALRNVVSEYETAAQAYANPSFQRVGRDGSGAERVFICFDPALARQLDRIVRSIGSLQPVSFDSVEIIKDARATDEAFERLSTSLFRALALEDAPAPLTREQEIARRAEVRLAERDLEQGALEQGAAASASADLAPIAAPTNTRSGLLSRDYLPLVTASVVDLMILIFTLIHGPQLSPRMEEVRRGMDFARQASLTAADLVRLSKVVANDPNFQLLDDYRFTYADRDYIAVPVALAEDDADIQDDQNIDALMRALAGKGLARRSHPILIKPHETISKKLALRGSRAAGRAAYAVYALSDSAWSEMLDGFFVAAQDREAGDAGGDGGAQAETGAPLGLPAQRFSPPARAEDVAPGGPGAPGAPGAPPAPTPSAPSADDAPFAARPAAQDGAPETADATPPRAGPTFLLGRPLERDRRDDARDVDDLDDGARDDDAARADAAAGRREGSAIEELRRWLARGFGSSSRGENGRDREH